MGSDARAGSLLAWPSNFNPRSPHGERLCMEGRAWREIIFQSTLPAWGATTIDFHVYIKLYISIHAPRMGSDVMLEKAHRLYGISIHAPRMGSDIWLSIKCILITISIHAPRMGSDICTIHEFDTLNDFNPRSPHGERPLHGYVPALTTHISIHAPRMGSDFRQLLYLIGLTDFNPRSPHGERRLMIAYKR